MSVCSLFASSEIMNWKGLGFIILIAAILLIFSFDKIVKLVIGLYDRLKKKDKEKKG